MGGEERQLELDERRQEMVGKAAKSKRKLGTSRMNPMAAAPPQGVAATPATAAEAKVMEAEAEEQTSRIVSEMSHVSPEIRARYVSTNALTHHLHLMEAFACSFSSTHGSACVMRLRDAGNLCRAAHLVAGVASTGFMGLKVRAQWIFSLWWYIGLCRPLNANRSTRASFRRLSHSHIYMCA